MKNDWGGDKARVDKGCQMRLEREAGWCTGLPWRAGHVSAVQGHLLRAEPCAQGTF